MTERKEKTTKVDFKKEYKYLFSPSSKEPVILEVPAFKYIMVEGQGYPGTSMDFQEKIAVIFGLSYTIKFMMKRDKEDPFDYTVPPPSGLYCADDMTAFTEKGRGDDWKWILMIMQPDRVTQAIFDKAKVELKKKKNPPGIEQAYLKIYEEGLCAQIMHIGLYSQEGPTIQKLHSFFLEKGYTFNGYHNEIYLSDPRRCQPEKLKTIIRQPIRKKR